MAGYDFKAIEQKWQAYWEAHGTFVQPNPTDEGFEDRPKFYVLDMFPYPSGAGLHVGHPEGYTATDIVARYKRMKGFNVLHPMGYDAFGLPAEQYAVEHGVHPKQSTAANIDNIDRQIRMFGFSYDWTRRLATTEPDYYRWTQWVFLRMFNSWYDPEADAARPIEEFVRRLESSDFVIDVGGQLAANVYDGLTPYFGQPIGATQWYELSPAERRRIVDDHRLAYMAEMPVNWCPQLGTVLANEEVTAEGRSDRGDWPVYRRPLRQWMLRITAYADRLLKDLDLVDWPEPIKIMQRNWIGKSSGADVDFPLAGTGGGRATNDATDEWFDRRAESGVPPQAEADVIRVYTTRPDTLFGATYMVLAPEHPLVEQITTDDRRQAVEAYVQAAARKSELERAAETKDKTGVFTGAFAVNPVNREKIPIWVADYVMMGYGTGAIMAVPAHDTRDFEFAASYGLPIRTVVLPDNQTALKVPVSTSYAFPTGEPTAKVSDAEWDAIATSIVNEFRGQKLVLAGAPEGYVRIMTRDGETIAVVANNELSRLHDALDPAVFAEYSSLLRQRASETLHESFEAEGMAVNSGKYDGMATPEMIEKITADLESAGLGRFAVNYKLRDWLFSRQRYWGEPFPIVHCDECGPVAVPDPELPLELPEMEDFTPAASDDPNAPPQPPLAKAADWVKAACPICGKPARRETNTMPQWAGSCWYYLRFLDPKNGETFCDPAIEKYWMGPDGIDLYVGGAEHAVLHLLYARFWHKVLYDLGCVSTPEPFGKLFNQGMIRSFAYRDGRGVYVGYEDVDFREDGAYHKATGEKLAEGIEKMSKSLGNVINPDDVIDQYGADTFRLYEMFLGPLEASKPWNTRDVPGVHRFCHRVWRMICGDDERPPLLGEGRDDDLERALHRLIRKAGDDIEAMKFNTAIAAMMEFVNAAYKAGRICPDQAERFVLVLAPFAPHLGEELWQRLGHEKSLAYEPWPAYEEARIAEETAQLAVQVNGKVRGRIEVPADAEEAAVVAAALAEPKVAEATAGKTVVKTIVVAGRLVNVVVK